MKKIILIEESNVIKLRLEKILTSNNLHNFEFLNIKFISQTYISKYKDEIGLFIFELDNQEYTCINLFKMIRKETSIPIIALSQSSDVTLLKDSVQAGANDFIIKPFKNDALAFRIKKVLGSSKQVEKASYDHTIEPIAKDAKLIWHQDFKVGIDQIDNEHAQIIDKYNQLYQHMKKGQGHDYYKELLAFLKTYVQEHFSHEQVLHKEHGYPHAEEHYQIHESFKQSLFEIYDAMDENPIPNKMLIQISLFIKQWLIHHILIEDKKFGDFMKNASSN
ncbi:bacteriohemerythrin [Acidaminobacter sp. JC074]|uniref:bacteriohemerythrin n=1 Tax=Acidaminobacter sp. JC074 TaxID=2530199 RepID=UPI001F0EBC54|nr:bacteriohemerythrin [Acidaminobacter sp. JC074]MCH4890348.1 bacteriohemerythrin [Acidaminobacter sp. JC074]